MENLTIPMKWVEGFAPQRLAGTMGCSVAEAVGCLICFLASTRRSSLEVGTYSEVASHCIAVPSQTAMMNGLLAIKVLERQEGELVSVVPNLGFGAKRKMRTEKAKHARSMVGKKKAVRRRKTDNSIQGGVQSLAPVVEKPEVKTEFQKLCGEAWHSYEHGFRARTNQAPLRNAKANSLIVQFVKQVGHESPDVLQFFCTHPSRKYLEAVYPLQMAVADAQALHTQWRNNRYVTHEAACQASKTADFSRRLAELDARISQDEGAPQGSFSQS